MKNEYCDFNLEQSLKEIEEYRFPTKIEKRLKELARYSIEDEPYTTPINPISLKLFHDFINIYTISPSIVLTPMNNIQIEYKNGDRKVILDFQDEERIRYLICYIAPLKRISGKMDLYEMIYHKGEKNDFNF